MIANCAHCGAEFRSSPSRIASGRSQCCSRACTRATKAALRAEQTCQFCGDKFLILASRVRAGHGKYCSIACASAASVKPKLPGSRKRISYAINAPLAEVRAKQALTQRRCLGGCGEMFASTGPGNRICDRCAVSEARTGYPAQMAAL